ncbi:MAG TPA: hypothetical protein DCW43_01340 [Clostridiales bacterium]|nr:hypothetical protein [Clostridiales bacterium]
MAKKTAKESILQEKPVKSPKVKVRLDERFKSLKSISILSIVLVVAICIVFNLIIDMTLDKKLTFDSTSVRSNSVSSMTSDYLETLDKKVEIYGLFDKNDNSLEWREYFIPILDDYEAKANGMIELKYIDPDVDPFIISQLDPNNVYGLQKDIYVVKSGDMLVPVDPYSCFEYDQDVARYYGVGMPIANNVERIFTTDIVYVTSGRPLHAYYLDGHTLPEHKNMDNILMSLGFVTSNLALKGDSAKIPDDCELLLILQPKTDLTLLEKEQVKTYLDNAGKVLIVCDFSDNKTTEYPNLNDVAKRMGISLEPGIIHENDLDHLVDVSDPFRSIANPTEAYAKTVAIPSEYSVENCRYIKALRDLPQDVVVSPLVVSSSTASVDFQNSQIDADVSAGMHPVVLWAVDSSTTDMACLITIGTQSFTSDTYYSGKTLEDNNAVFIRSLIHEICPIEFDFLVPQRKIPSYTLSKPLSSSSATFWSFVVMTVIPVGSLACGIIIYHRRRHL